MPGPLLLVVTVFDVLGCDSVPEDLRKPRGAVPGKLNLPSRWLGEGLGGVVALGGLDDVGKGAGEEGVEDVVEDGLLLESRWFMAGGCSCRARDTAVGGDGRCPAGPH